MKFLQKKGSTGRLQRKMVDIWMIIALVMFVGCSDGGGNSASDPPALTGQLLADTVVDQWLDVDYSFQNPNGVDDTDSDGQVDTNDAVDFVESINSLGYNIPETLVDGLYNNYYTVNGYDEIQGTSPEIDFTYTLDNPVAEADLQAHDWSGLEVGDLIFVDYDKDFVWDNAAIYLGAYGSFTHAVVFASDYYDKVVIEDLDDVSILVLDIDYGYSDVRTPAYDAISGS